MSNVKLITRQIGLANGRNKAQETLIVRDGEVVAVLQEGDPLRYLLVLPFERLQSLRAHLALVLEARPRVKEVLEALIENRAERESGRKKDSPEQS